MNLKEQTLKQISNKKAGAILHNVKSTPLFCLSGNSRIDFARTRIQKSPVFSASAGLFKFKSEIARTGNKKIKRYVLIIGPSLRERQKNGQFYRSRKAGSGYFSKVEPAKANWQKSNLS